MDTAALASRLQGETAAREAAERRLAALEAEKRDLEQRVITANRTLAYGLGRAIIEARSLKGLAALPSRIRRLRLKQKAKRRQRVPDTIPIGIAERLRLVDPALEMAHGEGVDAAAIWIREQSADAVAKARALAELGFFASEQKLEIANALVNEAAQLNCDEHRLIALDVFLKGVTNPFETPTSEDLAVAAKEFGLEGEGRILACVSMAGDQANLETLAEAFITLRQSGSFVRLVVLGDSATGEAMGEKAKRLDFSDAYHFLGMPVPKRWPALLGLCEVVVFPTLAAEIERSEVLRWKDKIALFSATTPILIENDKPQDGETFERLIRNAVKSTP